jgi:predicted Zn-dependent protease
MNPEKSGALSALAFVMGLFALCHSQLPGQESVPQPTPQGGTSLSQSNVPEPDTTDATPTQSAQQQIKLSLLSELENLTPGKFAAGSATEKAFTSAVDAFVTGNLDETKRILDEQRKANPVVPPVELLLAGLFYGVGNSDAGLQTLEQVALKYPDYPGVFFAFARLAISQRRMTDAQALLEKAQRTLAGKKLAAEELEHFNVMLYESSIDIAMNQKQYDEVRKTVDKLKAIRADDSKINLTQAELDFIDKDYKSSFARLQDFHKANPNSVLPELVMASWFQQQANDVETQNWIRRAAEAYPDNASVQLSFANYALSIGDFPAANSAVKKVEEVAGEIAATVLVKAKMAFANQAYGMAEVHYEKLAKAQPSSFDNTNMYALSLIESDSKEKQNLAISIAQRNFQQLPDNPIAQAAYGWVLLKAGETENAQTLLTRAARSPQLAPEIAFFLATLMHQTGKSQQAKLILEPAMESKGLFLYRNAAAKLMSQINEATESQLPSPK